MCWSISMSSSSNQSVCSSIWSQNRKCWSNGWYVTPECAELYLVSETRACWSMAGIWSQSLLKYGWYLKPELAEVWLVSETRACWSMAGIWNQSLLKFGWYMKPELAEVWLVSETRACWSLAGIWNQSLLKYGCYLVTSVGGQSVSVNLMFKCDMFLETPEALQ